MHTPTAAVGAAGHTPEARLIAREAGGAGAAQLVHGGLRYAGAFFAVRVLGASAYGAYTLTLAVAGLGSVIAGLGLSPGVLPFLSKAKRTGAPARVKALVRTALVLVTGASIAIGVGVFLVSPWLSDAVFRKPDLSGFLRAMTPLIVLGSLVGVLATFLQGFVAVKERAWIEKVLVTGLTVAGLALSWAFGWGWPGVVAATLAGPAAGIVCAGAVLSRLSPGALGRVPAGEPSPVRDLLAYCWPLLGTSMLMFALMWSDILIMGVFRNGSEVGIYGLCARLAAGVAVFQESIGQVFVPRLSDLFVAEDREAMRRLYHLASRWAIWPALVFAAMLVVWAPQILAIFGPEFAAGAAPLAVLASAKAAGVCAGMSGRIFAVTGRARLNLSNLLLMVACNLVLNLLWVPRHGAIGAAVASMISIAAINALQVVQVRFLFGILPWDRRALLPIVGVTGLALVAFPVRLGLGGSLGWLAPLALFAAACTALFLAWGRGEEEREVERAIRARLRGKGGR